MFVHSLHHESCTPCHALLNISSLTYLLDTTLTLSASHSLSTNFISSLVTLHCCCSHVVVLARHTTSLFQLLVFTFYDTRAIHSRSLCDCVWSALLLCVDEFITRPLHRNTQHAHRCCTMTTSPHTLTLRHYHHCTRVHTWCHAYTCSSLTHAVVCTCHISLCRRMSTTCVGSVTHRDRLRVSMMPP